MDRDFTDVCPTPVNSAGRSVTLTLSPDEFRHVLDSLKYYRLGLEAAQRLNLASDPGTLTALRRLAQRLEA